MGWCLTALALALLVTGIAGSAPWVAGTEIGCREAGPSSFFLFCWLGSVGLAAVAIACFVTAQAGRVMRFGGASIAGLCRWGPPRGTRRDRRRNPGVRLL